jgi:hypothetical protein
VLAASQEEHIGVRGNGGSQPSEERRSANVKAARCRIPAKLVCNLLNQGQASYDPALLW